MIFRGFSLPQVFKISTLKINMRLRLSHWGYTHCHALIECPEFAFSDLETFFENQRIFMSAYCSLIKQALERVRMSRDESNRFVWSDSDAIINAVGLIPELYCGGEKLLFAMVEGQNAMWCKQVSRQLADHLMACCRTFARCHESNKLTVWSLMGLGDEMFESMHNEFFCQLTLELMTSFQQWSLALEGVMLSSFVAWEIPEHPGLYVTCTMQTFRDMKLAFAMIETMRLDGFVEISLGSDIMHKIFELITDESSTLMPDA